jgi:hypothetical protein
MNVNKAERIKDEIMELIEETDDSEVRKKLHGAEDYLDTAIIKQKAKDGTLDTSGLREDPNLF